MLLFSFAPISAKISSFFRHFFAARRSLPSQLLLESTNSKNNFVFSGTHTLISCSRWQRHTVNKNLNYFIYLWELWIFSKQSSPGFPLPLRFPAPDARAARPGTGRRWFCSHWNKRNIVSHNYPQNFKLWKINSPPALPLRVERVARAALAVVLGKLLSGGGSAVAAVLTSVTGAAAAAVLHRDNNT